MKFAKYAMKKLKGIAVNMHCSCLFLRIAVPKISQISTKIIPMKVAGYLTH